MLKKFPERVRPALVSAMQQQELEVPFGTGSYPKVRTGHLKRSIYNKVYERAANVIGVIGTEVIYGKFLEEGTKHMKARPFLRPTVLKNETKLSTFITNRIAQELNK